MTNQKLLVTIVGTYDGDYFVPRRLIDAYRSDGYEVKFVGWDRLGRMPRHRLVDGIPHECIMRGWGFGNLKLLLALPLWTMRLALYMATLRTDLVHAMDFDAALGVAIGLRARRIPFLYDIQDNFELRHPFPSFVRWSIRKIDNWIIDRSASTIVVGEERIVGDMPLRRDKVVIIPNCPPDVPPPAGMIKDPERFTLAFVGRLAEPRGVRLLLDACQRLTWLRVIMVGNFEDEELEKSVRVCAEVELHGYMPQEMALELVHRSDASFSFYDPSTEICRRANGAKWYDAMMAGKCLLVNSEVINSDWIVRSGIGFSSPYGDVESFICVLRDLHEHREKLVKAGIRARKLYEAEFNREAMNRRLYEVVKKALSKRIKWDQRQRPLGAP
jgi:glycosyltransferase involved in cell wall biosynthesis